MSQPVSIEEVLQPSKIFVALLLDSLQDVHVLLIPRAGCSTPGWVSQEQSRRAESPLALLATLLWMQPRIQVTFWALSTNCWFMSSPSSTCIPKSFSAGLFSIFLSPSLYSYQGLPQPRCRTLHLVLLNLVMLTWPHLSSLSRSPWMAFLPSSVPAEPLTLVSIHRLAVDAPDPTV